MKICVVVPGGLDPRDDRQIPCLRWIVERLSHQHEVEVYALRQDNEGAPSFELAGATVHPVAGRPLLGVVRLILRSHRRKRFDVVQAFWATRPGVVALVAGRLMRRPVCVHVSGGELVWLADIEYGSATTWRKRTGIRTVLRKADAVTAASGPVLEELKKVGVAARCLPLGVDVKRWTPVAPPAIAEAPYRLIHVASINRVKDQGVSLRAAAKLCSTDFPFHLDFVGVDTLDGEMQQLARRLRLHDAVTFHGWLPQERVRDMMCRAHLNLVTSRHEAGPLVVREAAACGVITLGTAVGHIADWSPRGAIALETTDGMGVAKAIRSILRDDDRRVRLARWAQREVTEHDADWTAAQFETLYDELVSR